MENIYLIEKDIDSVKLKVEKEIERYKTGEINAKELFQNRLNIYNDVYKDWSFCKNFSFVPITANADKREVFKNLSDAQCDDFVKKLREASNLPQSFFEIPSEKIQIPDNDTYDNWSSLKVDESELLDIQNIEFNKEYTFNIKTKKSKEKENIKVKFFYEADSENPQSLSMKNVPAQCYIDGDTSLYQKREYIECDAYRYTGSKAEIYFLGTGKIEGYEPFECIFTFKKKKPNEQKLILILIPQKDSPRWAEYLEWKKEHEEKLEKEENEWLKSLK